MKVLATMTDRRRLLTEAFAKAGVTEEARELLLRDSGSDEDDYDVVYGSGSGQKGQPSSSSSSNARGYSPYGGGATAATPFKSGMAAAHSSHHATTPTISSLQNTHGSSNVTDQFIAAILDGDVQGMLSAVRSQGEDLNSPFWRSAVHSVQPLHRAISGLQYHGNENLLVSLIKALVKIGADVNAIDRAGNTPLHKAILVCTSKNVVNVVSVLLLKGSDPNQVNHAGDAPLHLECRRIRKASVYVISALLEAGAKSSLQASCGVESTVSTSVEKASPLTMVMLGSLAHYDSQGTKAEGSGTSTSSHDLWIFAAHALVTASPHDAWDTSYRSGKLDATQLHLLAALFPAQKESASAYKSLFLHALKHGGFFGASGGAAAAGVSAGNTAVRLCMLLSRDRGGEETLTTLLKKMATTPVVKDIHSGANVGYPADLLDLIMQYIFLDGPAGSNSRVAAEELVKEFVSCVQRCLDTGMPEGTVPASCLTHCVKFLEERGLMQGKQQKRAPAKGLGEGLLRDVNNTENAKTNYRDMTTYM